MDNSSALVLNLLAREIDAVLAGFVRGQVSVCLALGTFYAAALMAAKAWRSVSPPSWPDAPLTVVAPS